MSKKKSYQRNKIKKVRSKSYKKSRRNINIEFSRKLRESKSDFSEFSPQEVALFFQKTKKYWINKNPADRYSNILKGMGVSNLNSAWNIAMRQVSEDLGDDGSLTVDSSGLVHVANSSNFDFGDGIKNETSPAIIWKIRPIEKIQNEWQDMSQYRREQYDLLKLDVYNKSINFINSTFNANFSLIEPDDYATDSELKKAINNAYPLSKGFIMNAKTDNKFLNALQKSAKKIEQINKKINKLKNINEKANKLKEVNKKANKFEKINQKLNKLDKTKK